MTNKKKMDEEWDVVDARSPVQASVASVARSAADAPDVVAAADAPVAPVPPVHRATRRTAAAACVVAIVACAAWTLVPCAAPPPPAPNHRPAWRALLATLRSAWARVVAVVHARGIFPGHVVP